MKKTVVLILSASSLLLTSANALTVIDANGNAREIGQQKKSEPKQTTQKEYYDSLGRYQGQSKKQSYSNRTDHYDSLGRYEGSSEKNPYSYDGEVRHYDNLGRYQGSTRER